MRLRLPLGAEGRGRAGRRSGGSLLAALRQYLAGLHGVARCVTLETECPLRIGAKDHPLLRCVRVVARQTVHRLAAPWIDHIRSEGVTELRVSLVTRRANRIDVSL